MNDDGKPIPLNQIGKAAAALGGSPPPPVTRQEVATLVLGIVEALSAVQLALGVVDDSAADRQIMSELIDQRLGKIVDNLETFMMRDF